MTKETCKSSGQGRVWRKISLLENNFLSNKPETKYPLAPPLKHGGFCSGDTCSSLLASDLAGKARNGEKEWRHWLAIS